MDAQAFWNVIGCYNQSTVFVQAALLLLMITCIIITYSTKHKWCVKAALGIINLFIGVVFFGIYGTEAIQKFFALPLYLGAGVLFLYESFRHKEDTPLRLDWFHWLLLGLYVLYPFISFALGHRFPQIVTHIMPCPVMSLSIILYSCYQRKNKWLLLLLAIWGLTGVKAIIFNAYEDLILLLCGIYCTYLFIKECRRVKS